MKEKDVSIMTDKDNNVSKLYDNDLELTQASEWLAKLVSGNLTDKDKERLQYWLSESPSRAETLLKLSDTWDELSDLSQLSTLLPLDDWSNPRKSRGLIDNWLPKFPDFSVVSIVVLFAMTFAYFAFNSMTEFDNDNALVYMTDVGEREIITLPDGTIAKINTNSKIKILFDNNSTTRIVSLIKGEVYFDVVSDENRPFIVMAGDKRVKALGTAFNLFFQENTLEVIVTEGIVEVLVGQLKSKGVLTNSLSKNTNVSKINLTQGHSTVIENSIRPVDIMDKKVIDKKLLWQHGKLYFEGESLIDVLAIVSRYTNYDFVFLDEKAKEVSIGGYYNIDDIDGLLTTLKRNFIVNMSKNSDGVIYVSYDNDN